VPTDEPSPLNIPAARRVMLKRSTRNVSGPGVTLSSRHSPTNAANEAMVMIEV